MPNSVAEVFVWLCDGYFFDILYQPGLSVDIFYTMLEWFSSIPRLELAQPWWLLLLLPFIIIVRLRAHRERQGVPALFFPDLERLKNSGFEAPQWARLLPQRLRRLVLLFMVVALTEPRFLFRQSEAEAQGIDVVLALDISESMQQRAVSGQSRLDAAREVARTFVLRRNSDRIGLVVFRGEGYTQCPLTLDHNVLALLLDHLSPTVINDDGTAIGSAILIAVNRLKAAESLRKVIILITDGENNAGEVSPSTAATLAAREGVRIYAINAGFKTVDDQSESTVEIGNSMLNTVPNTVESLQHIAEMTGGDYFKVEDAAALEKSIRTIDQQEKNRHSGVVMEQRSGLFATIVLAALVLLLLEAVLSNTRLLRIP